MFANIMNEIIFAILVNASNILFDKLVKWKPQFCQVVAVDWMKLRK